MAASPHFAAADSDDLYCKSESVCSQSIIYEDGKSFWRHGRYEVRLDPIVEHMPSLRIIDRQNDSALSLSNNGDFAVYYGINTFFGSNVPPRISGVFERQIPICFRNFLFVTVQSEPNQNSDRFAPIQTTYAFSTDDLSFVDSFDGSEGDLAYFVNDGRPFDRVAYRGYYIPVCSDGLTFELVE